MENKTINQDVLRLNEIEYLFGTNMESFINRFFYKPIQLQDGWDMVLNSSEFVNVGDCTPIEIESSNEDTTIYSFEFYVGDARRVHKNPFPYLINFIYDLLGENYMVTSKIKEETNSIKVKIHYYKN